MRPRAPRGPARPGSARAANSALRMATTVRSGRPAAAMNGRPGDSGLSATIAMRSISPRPEPLHEPVGDAIDGGQIRASVGDRLEARQVRSGHDDRSKEGRSTRDRRDRRAKQVHAAVAVPAVDRRDGAPERTEAAARIGRPADDKAAMLRAFAAGEGIFRRRDQSDGIAQILHIGVAAGLGEQEFWAAPQSREVDFAGESLRRLDPLRAQGSRDSPPKRVVGRGDLRQVVHRQRRDRRAACHAARPSQSG